MLCLGFVLSLGWSINVMSADREDLMLSGYATLSQRDPANYADDPLMYETDTTADGVSRDIVANLASLAAVYTMIERGRGDQSVMIDKFYPRPSEHGGKTFGAIRPAYVSDDLDISETRIIDQLQKGHPVILKGTSGEVEQHFVLVVGMKKADDGGWRLIALDPWPGKDKVRPGREMEIDFDVKAMTSLSGTSAKFEKMRLVTGFESPVLRGSAASIPPGFVELSGDQIRSLLAGNTRWFAFKNSARKTVLEWQYFGPEGVLYYRQDVQVWGLAVHQKFTGTGSWHIAENTMCVGVAGGVSDLKEHCFRVFRKGSSYTSAVLTGGKEALGAFNVYVGDPCDFPTDWPPGRDLCPRQGIEFDRSTLADWVGREAWFLRPSHERLFKH